MSADQPVEERARWMLAYKRCVRVPTYSAVSEIACGGDIVLLAVDEERYVKLSVTCQKCHAYEMLRISHEEADEHNLTLALVAAEARFADLQARAVHEALR